jgi:alkylation response protein AidB-like acyl-CoA dehydrogenase
MAATAIEETGAAQHLRDARITAIYEGTTGIRPTTGRAQASALAAARCMR